MKDKCMVCGTTIGWIECPTGGWWAHDDHPHDNHDAMPIGGEDGCYTLPNGDCVGSCMLHNRNKRAEVARTLAYEVWNYQKPSNGAVISALHHLQITEEAATAANLPLTFGHAQLEALKVAKDFILHHPAVHGEWPILLQLIDRALEAQ